MKPEFTPTIRSSPTDFFKDFFIDHVDTSYRNPFIALMKLIRAGDDYSLFDIRRPWVNSGMTFLAYHIVV